MELFFVYVLRSLKDGKLSTGYTSCLEKRLLKHNSGLTKSTKSRKPFELIYTEKFTSRSEAMRREKSLKPEKGENF